MTPGESMRNKDDVEAQYFLNKCKQKPAPKKSPYIKNICMKVRHNIPF